MSTHIVKCVDRPLFVAHDQDREIADVVDDVVARFGDLLFATCELPDSAPQLLHLEVVVFLGHVALERDEGWRQVQR